MSTHETAADFFVFLCFLREGAIKLQLTWGGVEEGIECFGEPPHWRKKNIEVNVVIYIKTLKENG